MRTVMKLAMLSAVVLPTSVAAQEAAPKPKPIGNPGTWIPAGSYPPGARASAEEGRVTFTLDVDETGRATACKVTKTSESPLLDETTCTLMEVNSRFEPPRDKKNKPIASKWSSSILWKLETPAPEPAPAPSVATPIPPTTPKPLPVAPADAKSKGAKR